MLSLIDLAIGLILIFILINLIGRGRIKDLAKELGEAFRAFQEGLYGGRKEEDLGEKVKQLEAELERLRRRMKEHGEHSS